MTEETYMKAYGIKADLRELKEITETILSEDHRPNDTPFELFRSTAINLIEEKRARLKAEFESL